MDVQLMAVFHITLQQGVPAAEVGQFFRRHFVLTVCSLFRRNSVYLCRLWDFGRNTENFCFLWFTVAAQKQRIYWTVERESGIQIRLPKQGSPD